VTEDQLAKGPISAELLGDRGPWTWALPTLVRALNDPHGPWEPPREPRVPEERSDDDFVDAIAYWAPLTTLMYGMLGWAQPDLGVQRWVSAGRPVDTPELMVLDRWWGEHALAFTAWAQGGGAIVQYNSVLAQHLGAEFTPAPHGEPVRAQAEWEPVFTGGGDPLHLRHVFDHLLGTHLDDRNEGPLLHDPPSGSRREASLVLDTYCGWYAALTRLGLKLPARPDGQSWRVHVTVKPLGYLGAYRRSRTTGRWFSGRHKHHLLGWPG
jgi:hypothetical protein